jgi:hypothetical protein
LGEPEDGRGEDSNADDVLEELDVTGALSSPVPGPTTGDPVPSGDRGGGFSGTLPAAGMGRGRRTPAGPSGRPFISYVAVNPNDEGLDPDRLDHGARMALEEKAIEAVVSLEPHWRRTPARNPGFDLFEVDPEGHPTRWCEVKAMAGGLEDRPVGMSHTQFECAREHGSAYWLYVVEHADSARARIVRIQDPAGKARTFTFDRGWLDAAEVEEDSETGQN